MSDTEIRRLAAKKGGPFWWLTFAIEDCCYSEDLDALDHFVFHPRLNGASVTCLLCFQAIPPAPDDANVDPYVYGHDESCLYALKYKELNPRRGELDAWVEAR